MNAMSNLDHSEVVLRRTIHISDVPVDATEVELMQILGHLGSIERIHFDKADGEINKQAFVQFSSEHDAVEAVRLGRMSIHATIMRISHSRITIDVIPPTDAVFGKPVTVGRHVMAVNPSENRHKTLAKRDEALGEASKAAARVLESISARTGWEVSTDELRRLRDVSESDSR